MNNCLLSFSFGIIVLSTGFGGVLSMLYTHKSILVVKIE